jgi:nucleoside 2-deoxyribosyltransferase
MKLYLIGSLRNPVIPEIGVELRSRGFEVFDDWHAAGPTADDEWKRYENERGRSFIAALDGEHALTAFGLDLKHLNACDAALLVMPAGKSGFLELGYVLGQGKPGVILLPPDDEDRWDIMFRFASLVTDNLGIACRTLSTFKENTHVRYTPEGP